ncbi:ABC transporter substrate-binding protein [Thalassospira povalilytica]|uniref:ABC transporter substrate-binding protein n=1 Tax=Thalassospira povalilytica TaxID=732237 RepID=UPI003AA7C64F
MHKLFLTLALIVASGLAHAQSHDVQDDRGRTVPMPDTPERIVVLQEPLLGIPILELGLDIVGSYGRNDDGSSMLRVDFIKTVLGKDGADLGISGIGPLGNIDLEKLSALKPDLIIGGESDADKADILSSVAPVYLKNIRTPDITGFSTQQKLADLLGVSDRFDALMADYKSQLDDVRAKLPEAPNGKTYLAVIIYDQINVVSNMSGVIQAIEDLGYRRADLQGSGKASGYGQGFAVPLSSEQFARLNPDILIIMNSYVSADRGQAAIRDRLNAIVPGWDRFLRPHKEGRVLYLDSVAVTTPTVASARHTLDAIEAWATSK